MVARTKGATMAAPVRTPVRVDDTRHHVDRRSSLSGVARSDALLLSSIAEYADAVLSISFARRSSRFSRSRAFMRSAISVGVPARQPLSTSAFLTHSQRVCAVQPIFAAIDITARGRDACWASVSRTILTARSRRSGANPFVVLP